MQPLSNTSAGWSSRLLAGPAALTRTGRRLARTGIFALEMAARHRDDELRGRCVAERARRLGWAAENLLALGGVQVEMIGELSPTPSLLILDRSLASGLEILAILALAPSLPLDTDRLTELPLVGPRLEQLVGEGPVRTADATRALDAGISVIAGGGSRFLPPALVQAALAADAPVRSIAVRVEDAPDLVAGLHPLRALWRSQTRITVTAGPTRIARAA